MIIWWNMMKIHLATRNADMFFFEECRFCLHVSSLPLLSTASHKPLHLPVRWDQARTVPNSLVSEKGAALIASIKVWRLVKGGVFSWFFFPRFTVKKKGVGWRYVKHNRINRRYLEDWVVLWIPTEDCILTLANTASLDPQRYAILVVLVRLLVTVSGKFGRWKALVNSTKGKLLSKSAKPILDRSGKNRQVHRPLGFPPKKVKESTDWNLRVNVFYI